MDIFFALPTSSTYTPLSPSAVVVEDILTPIITSRPFFNIYPKVTTNIGSAYVMQPSSAYFYDSGIGDNPLAQHETNYNLRYKFLDTWLHEDYQDILRMLKVENNHVRVLSSDDAKNNDISKDDESVFEKKSDFIGNEILSISKNSKILHSLVKKNNMKYYDLPHNEHFVKKAQAKYIKNKLKDMAN
jgi:hypothetical protein